MTTNPLHIYFVLDRSGSMESIRADVIGGFNTFIAEQKAQQVGDDVRLTLVEFDSQDSHEVIYDAEPLANVKDLTVDTFIPRGGTPLYDAMARVITDGKIRNEARADLGAPAEDVVFVTFTDGQENQSREYDRAKVFDLVKRFEDQGWTFIYMGANQDAYEEGGKVGFAAGSTQAYAGDSYGTQVAYASLSSNMSNMRAKRAKGVSVDASNFFETKEAEEALEEDKKS